MPSAGIEATECCPRCRKRGSPVPEDTVKIFLRGPALEARNETVHRFCPTPDCPVVYFGFEESFTREEITVPVFQKEPPGNSLFCYCFEIPETAILKELSRTGNSPLLQKIAALVKAGKCACRLKNPSGSCCLGSVKELKQD